MDCIHYITRSIIIIIKYVAFDSVFNSREQEELPTHLLAKTEVQLRGELGRLPLFHINGSDVFLW